VTSFSCTAAAGDVMAQRESESTVPRFPPRPCLPPDSRPTGWTQWAAALGIVSHVTQLQSAEVRRDLRPNELLRIASRHRRLTHSVDFFCNRSHRRQLITTPFIHTCLVTHTCYFALLTTVILCFAPSRAELLLAPVLPRAFP